MRKYSTEVHKFIADNVKGRTAKELAELVNAKFDITFTESTMKSYKNNHKLKSDIPRGKIAGTPTKLYPGQIRKFIRDNVNGIGPTEMTSILNNTFSMNYTIQQIDSYYRNNKLNSGLTGRFEKGHTPPNKGKKGIRVSETTEFKKGHIPANHKEVGSERINHDGNIEIKVAEPNKWRTKHANEWEQHNGPIPKGHVVIFADRNNRNFDINNLLLVSKKQLLIMNQKALIRSDAELTKTGVIIANLQSKIYERRK